MNLAKGPGARMTLTVAADLGLCPLLLPARWAFGLSAYWVLEVLDRCGSKAIAHFVSEPRLTL